MVVWKFFRWRSEEHTSELQSRVDISYAVFCLKKKKLEERQQPMGALLDVMAEMDAAAGVPVKRGPLIVRLVARQTLAVPNGWVFFFFNDTATTEIYTLSLHDALPI